MLKKVLIKNSFLLAVVFSACQSGYIFNAVDKIPEGKWHKENVIEYNVPVSDTLHGFDIQFHLRNDYNYAYRNVWLFVETSSPNGNVLRDTVEFFLADQSGKWLGKGLGNVNAIVLDYKKNIRFPVSGIYHFKIEQAMRTEELKSIMDIGLRIKKTK